MRRLPMGISMAASLPAALLALAACDSATPLRANLGLAGDPPALDATLGGAPGAQTLTFAPPAGGSLPDDWNRAQSIRVLLGSAQSPLVKTPAGLVAGIPATVPFARPLDERPVQMVFIVDGDHVSVARVTFK